MKYPFIGKSIGGNDCTVLFYENQRGIALRGSREIYMDGDYNSVWFMDHFTDITAEYLRNTKIKIESPEHSEMIQQLVFNAGGRWESESDRKPIHTWAEIISIDDKLTPRICSQVCFSKSKNKEIALPLPPKQESASEEKPIYTREMHERGELPPVGSEVFIGGDDTAVWKVLINEPDAVNSIIVETDGEYFLARAGSVKPLPTPEENLADTLLPIIAENTKGDVGCASLQIAKAIINGEIDGVKWEG